MANLVLDVDGNAREREAELVRQLVRSLAPSWTIQNVNYHTPIGPSGLGLDSVAIVELLVACEERFGVAFPDQLLDVHPLTIGTLVRHLDEARAGR